MPGRKPCVHVAPELVEVAQPMLEEPPPDTRPTWNADTIVDPNANVSGSTSVWCCACASVYGSVLTCVNATFPNAPVAPSSSTAAGTAATVTTARVQRARRDLTGPITRLLTRE